jgi:DNA-binding response OmpR family regulator
VQQIYDEPRDSARILVVDDDPDLCDMLTICLSAEGYAVDSARDGRSALDEVARFAPTRILLDLWLPVLDGRKFAARLRADGSITPLIVVSAAEDARSIAREIGSTAFLEKPFVMDDLLGVVARIAGSSSCSDSLRHRSRPTDARSARMNVAN